MKGVNFYNVKITDPFWKSKQELVRDVTVNAVYNRFNDTGRFDAFKCDKNSDVQPHIFWDSDVAKWIEGVAYLTMTKREPELEKIVDDVVDNIEKNRNKDGYFNSFYLTKEPENIFKNRDCHELYCLGHLIEAGVAYYKATGKRKLLDLMCDYVNYVEKRFKIDKDATFLTPGHEEIELALVRLYEVTGEERHLDLAKYFVDIRGTVDNPICDWTNHKNSQSHIPAREQFTAEGHSVRAVYFYSAMADIALKYNDNELKNACEKIFDDIVNRKMYITGGIGSSSAGEAFTVPYDLPNLLAYSESCAAIGLVFFAKRMLLLTNDSKYASVIERILYNGFLSSMSLDGKSFFYTNPLELIPYMHKRDVSVNTSSQNLPITRRQEVFECSCCPPNIVRFLPVIGELLYTHDENKLYVHQYIDSESEIDLNGKIVKIEQKTSYPRNGKVQIKVSGSDVKLYARIPDFIDTYKGEMENGYAIFDLKDGEEIELNFDMTPRLVESNPLVHENAGKYAVMRGPVVYCMEEADNGPVIRDIRIDKMGSFIESFDEKLGVLALKVSAFRRKPTDKLYTNISSEREKITATLIPYYAFANREECEMQVWHLAE